MIWLVAVLLGVGVWWQHQRLTALKDQVSRLSHEVARLSAARRPVAPAEPVAPAPTVEAPVIPASIGPASIGPASIAKIEGAAPQHIEAPPAEEAPVLVAAPFTPTIDEAPRARPAERAPSLSLADWLSEHGLAWLGGGVLGVGGLLLVAYAASQGFFTPPLRIGAAVLVGVVSLGAGEWLRRRAQANDRLVAALTTAAGAVILYGAAWAAHGLYGLIPTASAGALLAVISLGLLALSARHGEALALLAIAGADVAPLVSGVGVWTSVGLDGYALLILATGMGAAGLRGWPSAAGLALGAGGMWALARFGAGDMIGCAALAAAGPLLTLARPGGFGTRAVNLTLPALAGAAAIAALLGRSPASFALASSAVVVAAVALAGAAAMRSGRRATHLLPAAIALALIAAETNLGPPMTVGMVVWLALPLVAVIAAALDGGRKASEEVLAAGAGAVSAALVLTLADRALAQAFGDGRAAVDALAAALVLGPAVLTARRSPDPRTSLALAIWVGASAEIIGLALHAATPTPWSPLAYAALAVALAALALRPAWRGFAEASTIAALASFAALLGPGGASEVFGRPELWAVVAARCAAVTALQVLAWRLVRRRGDLAAVTEALSTLALLSGLLGYFIAVRGLADVAAGAALDGFTQASLRSLVLLAAGLTLLSRGGTTPLGRWRGPVLLAAGAAHVVALQLFYFHPWWGEGRPVAGPPVADSLLLGLLAPALLLGEAGRRSTRTNLVAAALLAGGAFVLLLAWELSEVRRLFHGPYLRIGALGYAETAAYAVALLATAASIERARRWRRGAALAGAPAELWLIFDWVGGAVALLLLAWVASPWWGPLQGDLHEPWLLALGYAAAAGLGMFLARTGARGGAPRLAAFRRVGLVIQLFALLTLAIRYAFNGAAMRAALREESLETWTFSALWALFGLAILALAARRGDRPLRWTGLAILLGTTLKVFLFDLGRLSGVARAASFLALGAVLLVAALAARRLRDRSRLGPGGPGRRTGSLQPME
jgi:Predicted membrane protein (DUF2339)